VPREDTTEALRYADIPGQFERNISLANFADEDIGSGYDVAA